MNEELNPTFSLEQLRQMSNSPIAPSVDVGAVNAGDNLEPSFSLQDLQRMEAEDDPLGGLKAGVAGAARGLTFGLSDLALTGTGLAEPEDLRALEQAFPGTSIASEIVPLIASTLVTGGGGLAARGAVKGATTAARAASAATKGARAATAGIRGVNRVSSLAADAAFQKLVKEGSASTVRNAIAKAAKAGLGSSIEAGFYGAGMYVSDAALGNVEENAENLLASIGFSALFGGALGTTFNAAGQGIRSLSKNYKPLVRSAFKKVSLLDDETIDFVADERNYKALKEIENLPGSVDDKIQSFTTEVFDDVVNKINEFDNFYNQSLEDIARQFRFDGLSVPLSKIKSVIRQQKKSLNASGTAGPGAKSAIQELDAYEQQLTELAIDNIRKADLGKAMLDQLKNFKGNKAEQRQFLFRLAQRPYVRDELRLTSDQLIGISRAANREATTKNLFNPLAQTAPGGFEWNEIGRAARNIMDNFPGTGGIQLRALNNQYAAFAESIRKLKRFGVNKNMSEGEAIPRLATLLKGTTKTAKEAKFFIKQLDEAIGTDLEYSQRLGNAFSKISSDKIAPILTGYSTLIPALTAITGLSFGLPGWLTGAATLAAAGVQSPMLRAPLIRSGTRAAKYVDDVVGKMDELATTGNQVVPKPLVPFLAAKIAGMAQVERTVQKVNNETVGSIESFLQNPDDFQPPSVRDANADFPKTYDQLMDIVRDQDKYEQFVNEQLMDIGLIYPEVKEPLKNKIKQTTSMALGHLPSGEVDMNLLGEPEEPTDQEKYEFMQRMEVLNDPRVILRNLKNGTLSRVQVDQFKQAFPNLYSKMQQTFIDNIEKGKTNLSYDQKLQISLLFDVAGVPALRAQNIVSFQQSFEGGNETISPPQGISRGLLNVAGATQTQGQRGYGAN